MLKHQEFNLDKALEHIDNTMDDQNFEKVATIPDLDDENSKYTYDNGFYADCTAFFIDIRHSTDLTEKVDSHTRAKFYRAYIGQMVSILRSFESCKSINIVGDCVSAIFQCKDCERQGDPADVIDSLEAASMAQGMMDLINSKFKKSNHTFEAIEFGIGINRGETLVIKTGDKGSGIHKLVFLGDCVNFASHLCDRAGEDKHTLITEEIYNNCKNYICNDDEQCTFSSFFKIHNDPEINNDKSIFYGNFYRISIGNKAKEITNE